MLVVILGSVVLTLATLTALTTATRAVASSGSRRSWEQAVHLAEAGASRALGLIAADHSYHTHGSGPAVRDKMWVIGTAAGQAVERAREGEFAWVVPDGDGVVFGVGYVPSRAAARQTRVVRVDFSLVQATSPRALLTQGPLTVSGNPSITGLGGSLHSNGDLTISGNPTVAHDATTSATYRVTGHPSIGGVSGGGFPAVTIPAVAPASYRRLTQYDLCPDATVRANAATVCTGPVLGTGLLSGWNGWRFSATRWSLNGTPPVGGYYVYHADAMVSGSPGSPLSPWLGAIVVEGLRIGSILTNGDLRISSNPTLHAYAEGVALVVERDLRVSGNGEIQGAVMAGEQVDWSGGGSLIGSLTAAGSVDTTGSPVSANSASGNFSLRAEFGAPSMQGGVRRTSWHEL